MTRILLVLFVQRFIKKLEHSWKALVYDGVSRDLHCCFYEWAFYLVTCSFIYCLLKAPHFLLVHRTLCQYTGPGFMPAVFSSSWAHGSSGRLNVSLRVDTVTCEREGSSHASKQREKAPVGNGKWEILSRCGERICSQFYCLLVVCHCNIIRFVVTHFWFKLLKNIVSLYCPPFFFMDKHSTHGSLCADI